MRRIGAIVVVIVAAAADRAHWEVAEGSDVDQVRFVESLFKRRIHVEETKASDRPLSGPHLDAWLFC